MFGSSSTHVGVVVRSRIGRWGWLEQMPWLRSAWRRCSTAQSPVYWLAGKVGLLVPSTTVLSSWTINSAYNSSS